MSHRLLLVRAATGNKISLTSGLKPEEFLLPTLSQIFHSSFTMRILLAGILGEIAMFV